MFRYEFETANKKLLDMLEETQDKILPKATYKALNQTAQAIKRDAVRHISTETKIAQKHIKKRIVVPKKFKATQRKLFVTLVGKIWPKRVSELSPKPRALKSGRVKYKTIPGQPVRSDAFIAPIPGGKLGGNEVMFRKTPDRLPIKILTVNLQPVVEKSLRRWVFSSDTRTRYEEYLFKQIERETRSALRRRGMEVS